MAASTERAYRMAEPQEKPDLLRAWRHYRHRAEKDPNDRPFADPYYWAGFTCWGVETNASSGA